jgi:hypothetical protein
MFHLYDPSVSARWKVRSMLRALTERWELQKGENKEYPTESGQREEARLNWKRSYIAALEDEIAWLLVGMGYGSPPQSGGGGSTAVPQAELDAALDEFESCALTPLEFLSRLHGLAVENLRMDHWSHFLANITPLEKAASAMMKHFGYPQ